MRKDRARHYRATWYYDDKAPIPEEIKPAAFVTDMGGIISHAAIVSREMKKPCVVGTEKGTHIFKDGDLV